MSFPMLFTVGTRYNDNLCYNTAIQQINPVCA